MKQAKMPHETLVIPGGARIRDLSAPLACALVAEVARDDAVSLDNMERHRCNKASENGYTSQETTANMDRNGF